MHLEKLMSRVSYTEILVYKIPLVSHFLARYNLDNSCGLSYTGSQPKFNQAPLKFNGTLANCGLTTLAK